MSVRTPEYFASIGKAREFATALEQMRLEEGAWSLHYAAGWLSIHVPTVRLLDCKDSLEAAHAAGKVKPEPTPAPAKPSPEPSKPEPKPKPEPKGKGSRK